MDRRFLGIRQQESIYLVLLKTSARRKTLLYIKFSPSLKEFENK